MVSRAEDFPYSSARAHINGIRDDVLGEELFPEKQRRDYSEFVSFISSEDEMKEIRYFTRTGRPSGSEQFVSKDRKSVV